MKLLKALFLSLALTTTAWAQSWPTRNVTMIIPYGQGGSSDQIARALIPALEKRLGVEVVPAYHVGANATVAVAHLLANPNDNHTFMIVLDDLITGAVFSNRDYYKEFIPVNILATTPFFLSVAKTDDVKTAQAKFLDGVKNKKHMTVATPGALSSSAIWVRTLPQLGSAAIVPYKALPTIYTDLRGGHVEYTSFTAMATVDGIKGGHLTPVMVSSSKRFEKLPDVPTAQELGLTGVEAYGWFATVVRKDTTTQAQERLNQAINDAIRDGALARFDERLSFQNLNLARSNDFYQREIQRYQDFWKKNQHLFKTN